MTDFPTGYPPVEASVQIGSKNITFRADDSAGLLEVVAEFPKVVDELIESLTTVEQVLLAKGVMTGSVQAAPPSNFSRPLPPPTGPTPHCDHGVMKDIGGPPEDRKLNKKGQPYKARYYCAAPWGATDKCDPRD